MAGMDEPKSPRSEADLRRLGLTWNCCDSCHDDDALGYGMTYRTLPDGTSFSACCTTPDDDLIALILESLRLGREMEAELAHISAIFRK